MGWFNSHAIGLCVSTTTTVKTTKAAPAEIEAQVLNHNLIFLAVCPGPCGTASGSGPRPRSAC